MTKTAPHRPEAPRSYKIGNKYFNIYVNELDPIVSLDGKFPHLYYKIDPKKHPKSKNSPDQCYYIGPDNNYHFIGREHEPPIPTQDITTIFNYDKLMASDPERFEELDSNSYNPLCSHCNNIATHIDMDAFLAEKRIDYDFIDSCFDLSEIKIFLCDEHKSDNSPMIRWNEIYKNTLAVLNRLHVMANDINTIVRKRFKDLPQTLLKHSQLVTRLNTLISLAEQCLLPENSIFCDDLNSLMKDCASQLVDATNQPRFETFPCDATAPIELLREGAPSSVDQELLARIYKFKDIVLERSESFYLKIRETAEAQIFCNNVDMMIFPAIIDLLMSDNETDPEEEKIREITTMQAVIWLMGNYHLVGSYVRTRIPATIPDIIVHAYALDL